MSLIESGSDGDKVHPAGEDIFQNQLRNILEDFKTRFNFPSVISQPGDFGAFRLFVPASLVERAKKHIGWFIFALATK